MKIDVFWGGKNQNKFTFLPGNSEQSLYGKRLFDKLHDGLFEGHYIIFLVCEKFSDSYILGKHLDIIEDLTEGGPVENI